MTSSMDLDIRSVLVQTERNARELADIKDGMTSLLETMKPQTTPEWVTLEQAVAMKGVNLNTVKSNPLLRPGAGNPSMQRYCNGRLVFNYREVVLPWIAVTDDTLQEYLVNTCHITVIPDKIRRIMKNAQARAKEAS